MSPLSKILGAWVLSTFVMRDLAADDMQIAVSIRYLQIKGASHAHIYLYSGNGKLIRRLTNDEIVQDVHGCSRLTETRLFLLVKGELRMSYGQLTSRAKTLT